MLALTHHQCSVYLPLNSSWSRSSDRTSGSQGLDSSLVFSYEGTKARREKQQQQWTSCASMWCLCKQTLVPSRHDVTHKLHGGKGECWHLDALHFGRRRCLCTCMSQDNVHCPQWLVWGKTGPTTAFSCIHTAPLYRVQSRLYRERHTTRFRQETEWNTNRYIKPSNHTSPQCIKYSSVFTGLQRPTSAKLHSVLIQKYYLHCGSTQDKSKDNWPTLSSTASAHT